MSKPRGPWCGACGHEYRSKSGVPEQIGWTCPYCGTAYAVIPTKPFPELSKSQIEKFELCPTRWWFIYIAHRREPGSKYSKFGILGHEMGESWTRDGILPIVNSLTPKADETKAAISLLGGIPHMPPPSLPGIQAEQEFHFEFEGVHYMGYKDVWAPLGRYTPAPPGLVTLDGDTIIGDWKFVGKVDAEWNLTDATLTDDLQFVIEGWDDVRRGATGAWGNWVYMPRGERGAKPVRAHATRDQIYERMRKVNETGKQIVRLLAAPPDVRMMPTNGKACRAYNMDCPHAADCHITPEARMIAQLGGIAPQQYQPPIGVYPMSSPLDALVAAAQQPAAPPQVPQGGAPAWAAAPAAGQYPPQAPQGYAPQAAPQYPPQGYAPQAAPQAPPQGYAPQYPPQAPPAPAPSPVPAPGAINPPPAPQYDPNRVYSVMYNGQPFQVKGDQIPGLLAAGGQVLADPVAPPAQAAPQAPPAAPTAPTAPGRAPGTRGPGRPSKKASTAGEAPADGDAFGTFLARIRDAINEYLGA